MFWPGIIRKQLLPATKEFSVSRSLSQDLAKAHRARSHEPWQVSSFDQESLQLGRAERRAMTASSVSVIPFGSYLPARK